MDKIILKALDTLIADFVLLRDLMAEETKEIEESYKTTDSYGNTFWRNKDGQLHRDPKEGPAIIGANGTQQYFFNGKRHRDPKEGPAVIWADGTQQYYFNGLRVYP